MKINNNPNRIRLIGALLILASFVLIGKLYLLQIVHGEAYTEKADRQYQKPNQSLYDRGTIFFSTKTGETQSAAGLTTGFTLSINPKLITDPEATYSKINQLLPTDHDSFIAKATKNNDPYEEIAKHVDSDTGLAIDALNIPGVSIYKDRWRYYPGGKTASQVLGFVGYKGDVLAGRYGLENSYETTLRRTNNDLNQNFFAELFSDLAIKSPESDASEGDIVTTIEPSVQAELEDQLQKTQDKWSSTMSGGIIMDPKTGEIVGMASNPSFDPNTYNTEKNPAVFGNPLVEGDYEMGSIIKPLTMAAGLDSGAVTETTTYDDTGTIYVNGSRISNFDFKARGVIPMQQILSQSLNVGAAWVEQKIGNEKFTQYFKNYGLGEPTGIDLPNEVQGNIANLNSPRDVEHATASFGQGIAMTPVETIRALATLGNGGTLVTPHIVKEIDYKIGLPKTITYPPGRQVISPDTSRRITAMLTHVVDYDLAHGDDKDPGMTVAAKTGTAQMADPTGGYYADRYLHSFFGYFPATNPKFIIFLYTVYPKNVNYASQTLTDPFMNLKDFLVNYYAIPPDRDPNENIPQKTVSPKI